MGVKISELQEANSVQNEDVLPIVQNGETKKIQAQILLTLLNPRFDNIENELENLGIQLSELIESGSNANARYVKYSDGTLIQFGKTTLQSYNGRSSGGLTYWSKDTTIDLPYDFIDTSFMVLTNVELANMNIFCQSYGNANTKNQVRISFISTVDADSRIIDFMCIGRWK